MIHSIPADDKIADVQFCVQRAGNAVTLTPDYEVTKFESASLYWGDTLISNSVSAENGARYFIPANTATGDYTLKLKMNYAGIGEVVKEQTITVYAADEAYDSVNVIDFEEYDEATYTTAADAKAALAKAEKCTELTYTAESLVALNELVAEAKALLSTDASEKEMKDMFINRIFKNANFFNKEKGFIFSSVNFSGTSTASQFPVGMLIWNLKTSNKLEEQHIILDIYNTKGEIIGHKVIDFRSDYLSKWILRPATTHKMPPFGSAIEIKVSNKDRRDRVADGFLASLMCAGNDFGSQNYVYFLSAPAVSAGALSVVDKNFEQAVVLHAARRIPLANWINDRDQFLAPTKELSEEFITDCAVWSLFADSNQTAALKDVVYEGTTYQIHNHFFPFSVNELKKWQITDSDIRQTLLSAEDTFVCKWLASHTLSPEAKALLNKGKEIYRFYFENLNQLRTNKFKIETWDAGWYQVRMALKNADMAFVQLNDLKQLHRALRAKLLPQLTEYGII